MNPTLAPNLRSAAVLFAPIADDLEAAERILRDTIESPEPGVDRLVDHLSHYRGKRLRPALLLLTARACGNLNSAHPVLAAVVEMVHTATLVHDDVLDSADVRRHVQTVNARWGNQASILLGDYLFTHAFHLSASLDDVRACRIIGETTNRVCAGELHQVCERGNLDLSEEAYFNIIDGKTAELTACACRLGALYADSREDVVEHLANYGRCLGLAFQIADDLLDLVGEERVAGKSLGTDLDQKKMTLPLIHFFANADAASAQRVRQWLETPSPRLRELLRPELEATGSIRYARERALEYSAAAIAELGCLPQSEYRNILEFMADRAVRRDC